MSRIGTAKEALLVEVIGDFVKLLDRAETVRSALMESCQALTQVNTSLLNNLAGFEGRMAAITENAKTRTVQHLAVRADEATRRTIELQGRAMADAARVAFGAEFSATIQRLQVAIHPLIEQQGRRWERWLTHAATAAAASAVTWTVAVMVWVR